MSMCRCESCDRLIDSDDDPECFVEVGNMRRLHQTKILCEPCRERREDELTRDGPDPAREFSPEQQAIIDAAEADADDEGPST